MSSSVSSRIVLLPLAAALAAGVSAVEYLGTTQIVTLSTGHGELKARISSRGIHKEVGQGGRQKGRSGIALSLCHSHLFAA